MRRYFMLPLLTLMLMLVFSATALAADCALCGAETGSEDYLCTACLLSLLEPDDTPSTLEIVSAEPMEDGSVLLQWTDSGSGAPYAVYYELLDTAPTAFGWTAAEATTDTSIVLNRLVPGVSYVFTVRGADGSRAQYTYFAPMPEEDTEIGARIRLKPMNRKESLRMTKKQESWSASEIAAENEYTHGLYLRLTYSMLIKTRYYGFHIAVEAPNGFSDVVFSGNLELLYGRSAIPVWGFIPMDDYFSLLDHYYGGIPTGEYDVTIYFNGNRVHTTSFTVVE